MAMYAGGVRAKIPPCLRCPANETARRPLTMLRAKYPFRFSLQPIREQG